jgi:peptidyl-prolyl cis-trans isomerase D
MLQKMRDHSQSTATKLLLGLLIIVFTMFGFGAFEAFMKTDPPAAKIDGVEISQGQLAMEMDRQRQRILVQMGEGANPDLIDAKLLQKSVLDGLINQTILMRAARDMGMRVSDAEVDRIIVENPQFQVDGKFDADLYRRLLANAGHTPVSFKVELANNFTLAQLTGAVRETPFVTDAEIREVARLITQTRDIAFLVFSPEQYTSEVTVAETDVEGYYQAHLPDFMTPDTIDVDFVQLTLEDLAKDDALAPSEEQVLAQYQSDEKAFKPSERRRVAHILLQVNASRSEEAARVELATIKGRIANGERFEDVARKASEDPGSAKSGGDLGLIAQGALDPAFEQSAWSLEVGQLSEPVKSEFGVHLIKLLAIQTDQYGSLDSLRPQIIGRLREQAAEEKFRVKVRELDELAFETPDDLMHLAEVTGLPIQHIAGITQSDGLAPFDIAALRTAAFSDDVVSKGFNSRVTEVDRRAYVLRVKEHRPPMQRSLAEVSAEIRTRLIDEAATDRARETAAEAMTRVATGEGVATVAAAYALEWQRAPAVSRGTPGVDGEIIKSAFELARPTEDVRSVTSTELGGGRVAVVTISAVNDGDYGALTETDRSGVRNQLARRIGNEEFAALFTTLRDSASIDRIQRESPVTE